MPSVVEVSASLNEKCPVDLTGHARFSPTVKPFLRIAVLAALNLFPPQVAIWLTFSAFSKRSNYSSSSSQEEVK